MTVELPSQATLKPTRPVSAPASSRGSGPRALRGRRPRPRRVVARSADRPLPRVVLGRGLHLLAQLLARPVVQPVAEHRAEGVVGLVLQAAGEQAAALVGDVLARPGPGRRPGRGRAGRTRRTRPGRTGSPPRRRRAGGPCPRAAPATGLQTTPRWMVPASSGQSKTNTARSTPIWQAASPTPSAAYIVATMSATSARSSSSYDVTGRAWRCITSVPQRVTGRTVPPCGSSAEVGETGSGSRPGERVGAGHAANPRRPRREPRHVGKVWRGV